MAFSHRINNTKYDNKLILQRCFLDEAIIEVGGAICVDSA